MKLNKKIFVHFLFCLLILCTFLRYGLEVPISKGSLLLLSILIFTFGNNSEMIAMYFCCIPLYSSFDFLYSILYGSVVFFLKNYKKFKFNFTILFVLLIIMWELLHSFIGIFSVKQLVATLLPYIFCCIIQSSLLDNIDYKYIVMMFSKFVILVGINLVVRAFISCNGNFSYFTYQMGRLGNISESSLIMGGQINPNSLGIICILAITLLMQLLLFKKDMLRIYLYIISLLILGLLTQSRTFLVLMIISVGLFFISQKTSESKKIKTILCISALIVLLGIIFSAIFPNVINNLIERWTVNDISNGRFAIMSEAMDFIWSNSSVFLFGIGIQDFSVKSLEYLSYAPHDAINELLLIWGIPGLLMFIAFIVSLIVTAKRRNKNIKLINFIPLVIILGKSIAGHLVTSSYSMMAISLAYLSLISDFDINKSHKYDIYRVND